MKTNDGKKRRGMTRREFVGLLGSSAALLTLGGCSFGDKPFLPPDVWDSNLEEWVTTTCHQCPGHCGMVARVVDGKLKRLMGNPLHPISRGGLCPAGHTALQALYHPERLRSAMRNGGQKGAGRFEAVKWEEATKILAGKLAEMRKRNAPEGLVILSADTDSLRGRLIERFASAFGTPNLFLTQANVGKNHIFRYTQGVDGPVGYDLEGANFVLSFSADLVGNMYNPVSMSRIYGYLRQGRPGRKAKIVQVEPRLSPSATRADRWIPINVGAEGALAMGIAYVIIKEEKYDRDFIGRHTFGFDDWTGEDGARHQGFKNLVLQNYRLERVSELTGVSVDHILSIAKDFAVSGASVAVFDDAIRRRPNGTYAGMAVHALNALVGSFERPGGVVLQNAVPLADFPDVEKDEVARSGLKKTPAEGDVSTETLDGGNHVDEFIGKFTGKKLHGVEVLILDGVNPMLSHAGNGRLADFIKSVPLVVSVDPFSDETSIMADLLLPNHTFLERWDLSITPDIRGRSVMSVTQPAVSPLYDTMDTGDLLIKLAGAIGGGVAEAFKWDDAASAVKSSANGVYKARHGTVFDREEKEKQLEQLERRGWWFPEFGSNSDFWDAVLKRGGWWDPHYAYGEWWRVFKTPSRKFEFFSTTLEKKFEERVEKFSGVKDKAAVLGALELAARGELLYLPHHEEYSVVGDEREFEFTAYPFRTFALLNGERANQPWMQEILSPLNTIKWGDWVEISPKDAARLGIVKGDRVAVESPNGRIEATAVVFEGVKPGTLNLPIGQGHTAYGRWASGKGANPAALYAKAVDRISGIASWGGTRVKISKV